MTATATTPLAPRPAVEIRRRAMGSDAHLRVVGAVGTEPAELAGVLASLDHRLEELEALWSRFRDDSEVSRLNHAAPHAVFVSPETRRLVSTAVEGARRSGGAYDPTLLRALEAAGYDTDFERLAGTPHPTANPEPPPSKGIDGILIDDALGRVALAEGTAFDPGGVGKGLAADILVEEALAQGAEGAVVNLGGDLRVAGFCDDGYRGWVVGVHEPDVCTDVRISLLEGAIASSTSNRRHWTGVSGPQHHLLDPSSGRPTSADRPRLVTVVASEGWQAEVYAKAVHVHWAAGRAREAERLLDQYGASALVIDAHGVVHYLASMRDYVDAQNGTEIAEMRDS